MTKNQRAYLHLLRHLISGDWSPGQRIPSVRQLAAELQTSTRPLQVALRAAADQGLLRLHEKSRAEVLPDAADRARKLLAATSSQPRLRRLAILMPDNLYPLTESPFQAEVAQAISKAAIGRGLGAEVVPAPQNGHTEFAQKIAAGFDAAIVIDLRTRMLGLAFALRHRNFPLMLFRKHIPGQDIPSVMTDDHGAARRLAQLLVRLGHRNLCLVSVQHEELLSGLRSPTEQWTDCLRDAGVLGECTLPVICYPGWDLMGAIGHVLGLRPRITALVLGYPDMLFMVKPCGYFERIRVPHDMSVATMGVGRGTYRPPTWPPVTSFELNVPRAAELMVTGIESMLNGNTAPASIRLPLDIVITDSVGPPPPPDVP
ncbi:MAG: GntR family transcriptional regulator [Phycisphaerae bacterium]|nr:GntR family transcriptional regulator [Phycisphaerae bacterium]